MPANATINLFSALPQRFSALLFANKIVHLVAGHVLFVADIQVTAVTGLRRGFSRSALCRDPVTNGSPRSWDRARLSVSSRCLMG
jgi:hypothetical protein